jgi:hypothetical protein
MTQPGLADRTVATLATVAAMDASVTNETPNRHQIRTLKRIAQQTIEEAMNRAQELAYLAKDLERTPT